MGLFDAFERAKENSENRRQIAEYKYEATQLVNEGKEVYSNAYYKMQGKASDLKYDIEKFVDYKKGILSEMNKLLKSVGVDEKAINSSAMKIELKYPDYTSIHATDFLGGSAMSELKMIFDTISPPSIKDFYGDTRLELYEARSMRNDAKVFKQQMKNEKEKLNTVISSISICRDFISSEKREIEKLMASLKSAVHSTENDVEKRNALILISNMIVDTLTTQFISDNFKITAEYNDLHNKITSINNSALSVNDNLISWTAIGNLLK